LVQIPLTVQELSTSQNFYDRRCVTLTFDPTTLKIFSSMSTHVMLICAKVH